MVAMESHCLLLKSMVVMIVSDCCAMSLVATGVYGCFGKEVSGWYGKLMVAMEVNVSCGKSMFAVLVSGCYGK
jgi:hypothetical protein